jgi:hypothetical protein
MEEVFRIINTLANGEVLFISEVVGKLTFDDYNYPILLSNKVMKKLAKSDILPQFIINQILREANILKSNNNNPKQEFEERFYKLISINNNLLENIREPIAKGGRYINVTHYYNHGKCSGIVRSVIWQCDLIL